MNPSGYPFAAIVGQPELKLALLLASVDWRLSVLIKGDKGSGKSTVARGLADILPAIAPFVNLPIGTTEDRLLGGLDLNQALQGQANLKRGLIHEAHTGVLYIDEVNLLSDTLTDALLDVASSGRHYLERDGFSASSESTFILLGSMNLEEGTLRPQLLDRFALALDVEAPITTAERALILGSRLRFDSDPQAFSDAWEEEQNRLRQAIVDARGRLPSVHYTEQILHAISQAVTDAGVRSLRADLAVLRASISHAALNARTEVTRQDVEAVLPLALNHRAKSQPPKPKPESKQSPSDPGRAEEQTDRIFPLDPTQAPEVRIRIADSLARGRTAKVDAKPTTLDAIASFTQSFRNTGTASLHEEHLVFRTPPAKSGVRFIFVVDASGSHAAQKRMQSVKGAAVGLLEASVDHKDEVAVISFRGAKAEVVLEPCRGPEAALRVLEFLPTGGRTPLAHALELAASLVTSSSLLILLTDGRANVPLKTSDPWADALDAASHLKCPSVIVNSALASNRASMDALAQALNARLISLDDLSSVLFLAPGQ